MKLWLINKWTNSRFFYDNMIFGTGYEFCNTVLFNYSIIIIIVLNLVAVESQHCLMAANDEWVLNELMVKLHFHRKYS